MFTLSSIRGNGRDPSTFAKAAVDRPTAGSRRKGKPAEASAKAGKMSTFVSAISSIESRCYAEFMSTFVYPFEKAGLGKSKV
jgi:hypothetical protein